MYSRTRQTPKQGIDGMRATLIVASAIFVLLGSHFDISAQRSQISRTTNQSRDERVRQLLDTLEQDNPLRFALERGDRGSGVHYTWMDKMKQLGVRQASFRIQFCWRQRAKVLKITDVKYLYRYYRYNTAANAQSAINQIRATGMEQELADEILRRAKANLARRSHDLRSTQVCGMLYLNLLDDEVFPILDEPADLNDCKATCGP
jgi:hypothetical protein